jgi:hypothetical protein
MKLKTQENNTLLIDNLHPLFKDTDYEKETFLITIKLDTSSELASLTDALIDEKNRTGEQPTDNIPYSLVVKWKLLSPIIAWAGFEDVDGKEVPCTHENKSAFYEMPDYVDLFSIIRTIKEEHVSKITSKNKATKEATKKP